VLAKDVPRVEPVLTGDDGLRVVKRKRGPAALGVGPAAECRQDSETLEGNGVVRARRSKQLLRLAFELFKVGAFG
jgi:hypothetical protein